MNINYRIINNFKNKSDLKLIINNFIANIIIMETNYE